jgi:uncharacterized protein (DUF486 family)
MTYAWYGHLKDMRTKHVMLAVLVSWGIAFFEYCLQVPANRLGISYFNLPQLKVIQEVLTMVVFAGFCFFYMREKLTWDYLWASLCLVGAAFFMFRNLPRTEHPLQNPLSSPSSIPRVGTIHPTRRGVD